MKNGYLLLFLLFTSTTTYAQTTETEPNDSFAQANVIQDGVVMQTAISTNGDKDYFEITPARAGSVIRVSLENVPAAISPYVEIYNSSNTRLAGSSNSSYGSNAYVDVALCSTETYYIKVQSNYSSDKSLSLMNLKAVLDVADIYECNNSFADAKPIQAGVGIKIAIGNEEDVDYFKLNVTKPGVLNVAAENIPSAIRPYLKVYNPANQQIEAIISDYGQNAYTDKLVCEPGVYYFSISSYNPSYSSDKSPVLFDFKVTIDESDIYECNNSLATAKPIQAGVGIKISIGDEEDVDYFKLNVTKPGVLNVAAENIPSAIRPYLKVYNPANQQIEAIISDYGQNAYTDKLVCEPGVYYFSISSYNPSYSSDKSPVLFDFKVTIDESDIYECNNSLATAKPIQAGVGIKISIGDEEDVDYFKLNVTKPGVLNVAAENIPSAIRPYLKVYNSANQQIESSLSAYGQNAYLRKMVCEPGIYYFSISSYNPSYSSDKSAVLFDFKVSHMSWTSTNATTPSRMPKTSLWANPSRQP